jgi:hypothetical protein
MSLSRDLADRTLHRIVDRFHLDEVTGPDGGPFLPLSTPMGGGMDVGSMRLFAGGPVHKLVTIGLTVPPIGLDSHMIFAFTAPESLVPHFTLDSVQSPAGPPGPDTPVTQAFHLDLIPRLDLAANLAYTDRAYVPLSDTWDRGRHIDGLTEAHLTRRQWSLMSPWMLANRADEAAFVAIGEVVDGYLDHWFDLCERGVEVPGVVGGDVAARDRAHRTALFDPDVDPVWGRVAQLVGDDMSERLRTTLADQDMPMEAAR